MSVIAEIQAACEAPTDMREKVKALTTIGLKVADIALILGISGRQVSEYKRQIKRREQTAAERARRALNTTPARAGLWDVNALTIGCEFEICQFDREALQNEMARRGKTLHYEGYNHTDRNYYKVVSDSSLQGANPGEVVTPILNNEGELEAICASLAEARAKVNRTCGLHVHFGRDCNGAKIEAAHILNIYRAYAACQNAINSILPSSRRNNNYCRVLRSELINVRSLSEAGRYITSRYFAINVNSRHNTIEFRQHGGTIEFGKVSNWIKFLKALILWAKYNTPDREYATIDEVPFLEGELLTWFQRRAAYFARRENR